MFENLRERTELFDAEHSVKGQPVRIGGYLHFPDGALRECSDTGLGIWRNPPEDFYKCAKLVVIYHTRKLELAVQEFENLKQNLLNLAEAAKRHQYCSFPPDPENIEKLKMLREKVRFCKNNLTEAEKALEDSIPDEVKQNQISNEHNRRAVSNFIAAIGKIEV